MNGDESGGDQTVEKEVELSQINHAVAPHFAQLLEQVIERNDDVENAQLFDNFGRLVRMRRMA